MDNNSKATGLVAYKHVGIDCRNTLARCRVYDRAVKRGMGQLGVTDVSTPRGTFFFARASIGDAAHICKKTKQRGDRT